MSSEGTAAPDKQGQPPAMPNLQGGGQYIKDLSFENPRVATAIAHRPQIELAGGPDPPPPGGKTIVPDGFVAKLFGDKVRVKLNLHLSYQRRQFFRPLPGRAHHFTDLGGGNLDRRQH